MVYDAVDKMLRASVTFGSVDGFRVARTRSTTRRTQRFERRGLNVGDLGSQRNTVTKASIRRMHNALQRETPSFTQVQGPRGEVKPYFLPSCITTRYLARSTRSWLQSSNWPEVEEPT
jgi:hypothetical protein